MSILSKLRELVTANDGAVMVEYAMVLLFIVLASVALVNLLGGITNTFFTLVPAL